MPGRSRGSSDPATAANPFPLTGHSGWAHYACLAAIIVALFAIRWQFVGIPLERDEGAYILYGKLLAAGAHPYRDFYDIKPPGIFLVYALLVSACGYDAAAVQRGGCVVYAAILALFYLFLARLLDRRLALAVIPVVGLVLLNPDTHGFTVQSEFFVLLFVLLGLWVLMVARERRNAFMMAGAGVLLGFSALIKQAGIFYCVFGTVWLAMQWWQERDRRFLVDLAGLAAGGILAVGAVLLWLRQEGVVQDALFWMAEFPRHYYLTDLSLHEAMPLFWERARTIVAQQPLFWLLAAVGAIAVWAVDLPRTTKIVVCLLIVLSFLAVVPGYRFYGHYWIMFAPGIAVSVAMTYKLSDELLSSTAIARGVRMALWAAIPLGHVVAAHAYYLRPNTAEIVKTSYGGNPFVEAQVVGDYLRRRMKAGDEVFVAGSEPEIYVYTGTTGPSKHTAVYFLNLPTPFAREMRAEAVHDLETRKPRFIVFVSNHVSWYASRESEHDFSDWMARYIYDNYTGAFLAEQGDRADGSVYVDLETTPNYKSRSETYIAVVERQ